MAVFTKLEKKDIEEFLNLYEIGNLDTYNEILDGIENTNYKIICKNIPYILTIFEKRVSEEELPFFFDLKLYLNGNNFRCPKPLKNKENKIINSIKNKKAVIISFIEGEKVEVPNVKKCFEVGKMMGELHKLTKNFEKKRKNNLDIEEWKRIFSKCEESNIDNFKELITELKEEIKTLENLWPKNLPSGVIHADLFKDNIFFKNEKISGVIDFYFSCNHFFLYDISIVVNDWCFENDGLVFNKEFFDAIVDGYSLFRTLNKIELESFNIILRAAAVRILVTRLHDFIFHPKNAIVVKKNPHQYFNILKWHQNNNNLIK